MAQAHALARVDRPLRRAEVSEPRVGEREHLGGGGQLLARLGDVDVGHRGHVALGQRREERLRRGDRPLEVAELQPQLGLAPGRDIDRGLDGSPASATTCA